MPQSQMPDVRMRGFQRRTTVAAALAWIDEQLVPLPSESVPLSAAVRRALCEDVLSDVNVPGFDRAMVDGFALQAAETQGASPYNRLSLTIIGQSLAGKAFNQRVASGQVVRIMTGSAMPSGADAVLPVEQVEIFDGHILAQGEVSPGKHVGLCGEDITSGTLVLSAGRQLRPQDVGLLSSIGRSEVSVYRRPRVRIVTTGDELLPPGTKPQGTKIADSNGPMLEALVRRDGGEPTSSGIIPDDPEAILEQLKTEADVIIVSGGVSVGQEDHAPVLLAEHGELAIHGVAMRPSSPVGMGRLANRLVFLLPGNPVSCLCAYDFFAGRAIRALGGISKDWPYRKITAPLTRKIVSEIGRLDYARAKCIDGRIEPLAVSGASILSSTTRADGFVLIPEDSEGFPQGAKVEMYLYD